MPDKRCRIRTRGPGPFLVVDLFNELMAAFGPQAWWPADGPFEVMVGAILTQNTAWTNVEPAIVALKKAALLTPRSLANAPLADLETAIRSSGYYRQKAGRLRDFSAWLLQEWGGDIDLMSQEPTLRLRTKLLNIKGIGPETADSILLYAAGKPVFVIDAYTIRILGRVGLTGHTDYECLQRLFERNLPLDIEIYREYHALLVLLGKDFCRRRPEKSNCSICPVGSRCEASLLAAV